MSGVKEEAKKLIDRMPERATWDDIMYELYVKKKLTVALKAAEEGRITPHEEVKKRFLLEPKRILILSVIHGARDIIHDQTKPWDIA